MSDSRLVERKWLHANVPYSKNLAKLLGNLNDWSKKPLSSPFSGIKKLSRLADDTYVKNWEKCNDIRSIQFISTLPFSGETIMIKPTRECEFEIHVGRRRPDFDPSSQQIFQSFAQMNLIVAKFRKNNGKIEGEYIIHEYNKMDFFTSAVQLAHIFTKHFGEHTLNELINSVSKKSSYDFSIDRTLFNFLLSLESLHPVVVADAMFEFIEGLSNQIISLNTTLDAMLFGTDHKMENGSSKLSYVKDAFELQTCITKLQEELDKIRSQGDNRKPDGTFRTREEFHLPTEQLTQFIRAMENVVGTMISKNLPVGQNALANLLNFRDPHIPKGSVRYNLAEHFMHRYITATFAMTVDYERSPSRFEIIDSPVESPNLIMYKVIETSNLGEMFEILNQRCNHLEKTLESKGNMDGLGKVTPLSERLSWALDGLEKPTKPLVTLMNILRNDHVSIKNQIGDLEIEHNAKDVYEIQIEELEGQFEVKSENDKLIPNLAKYELSVDRIHHGLQTSISLYQENRKHYDSARQQISLASQNPISKIQSDKSLKELMKQKKDLVNGFKIFRTTLIKSLVDSEESGNQLDALFLKFCVNLETLITEFGQKVDELSAESNVIHSGPNAALLIGLGQGGEQIVRAAMAKMMNTLSDTRSTNLLTGLNVNLDDLKKVVDPPVFEKTVTDYDEDKPLTDIFDSANLLAINAGPEQALMLKAPYNYIWGSPNNDGTKSTSKKDSYLMQSENCILLDVGKKGCGGKMGKGRAFAVNAENVIARAIRIKRTGQKITQVCIVHSFAGGSGSGMILPVLRMIKQELPSAMVWVFSAGDTEFGNSTHAAENVVYITSDVLQSHYNALHHAEKTISKDDWVKFGRDAKKSFNDLVKLWSEIAECFPEGGNMKTNFERHNTQSMSNLKDLTLENKDEGTLEELNIPVSDDSTIWDSIPKEIDQVKKFTKTVKDPTYFNSILDYWRNWTAAAQDYGSYSLENHPQLAKVFSSSETQESEDFQLTNSQLKFIARGIRIRGKHDTADAAKSAMEKWFEDTPKLEDHRGLIEFGVNSNIPSNSEYSDYQELERAIGVRYSRMMQNYHQLIEEMREIIKLNLAVNDDPKVKHVILSNAHLDRAVKPIYTGNKPKYEIYNSTMVDLFLNLVHSLVAKEDFKKESELLTNTSSYEVMDANDMSGRTKPIVGATMLSFTNLLTTDNHIGSSEVLLDLFSKKPAYKLFEKLFTSGSSPLFDHVESRSEQNFLPQRIQSLYTNYLSEKNGIRQYSPEVVIKELSVKEGNQLFVKEEMMTAFWNEIIAELPHIDENQLKNIEEIEISTFTNMVNWVRLLGPKLVSNLYNDKSRPNFLEMTKEWNNHWTELYTDPVPTSSFNPQNRLTKLQNFVGSELANSSSKREVDGMAKLLYDLGIVSVSHIAAMPSSMFTEFAPLLLRQEFGEDLKYSFIAPQTAEGQKPLNLEKANEMMQSELTHGDFFEDSPIPSAAMARVSRDSDWFQNRLPGMDNLKKFTRVEDWEWTLNSDRKSFTYLRIVSPRDDSETWIHDTSPKFLKDYSTINFAAIELFPEFGNATLLDKLIDVSSDVHKGDSKRGIEELPQFRRAREDLKTYSQPRKLHSTETLESYLFRLMLLGNSDNHSKQSQAVYDKNIQSHAWVKEIQAVNQILYEDNFTPVMLSQSIRERIEIFYQKVNSDGFKLDNEISDSVIKFLAIRSETFTSRDEKMDNEVNQNPFRAKEFFDYMHDQISSHWGEILEIEEQEEMTQDKILLKKTCADIAGLLSRLSSLIFAATRQFEFASNTLHAGSGVAYDFEGTLDPIRSLGANYLMVVNASTELDASKIEQSVEHYYKDYLHLKNPKGKVFVQQLDYGPLAHMTLISQKAALVELSTQYKKLIEMLEANKFAVIGGPYVHPYSFLRNILWLNTFQCDWVEDAKDSYSKMFEIPNTVIREVFGQPMQIEQTQKSVQSSGDMSGVELSRYDRKIWTECRDVSKEINPEDDHDHYSRRLRGALHIPDMILINYFMARASEDGENNTSVENYLNGKHVPDELKEVYPIANWQKKFEKAALSTKKWPKTNIKQSKNPFTANDNSDKISKIWLEALKNWMEYFKDPN